MKKFFLLLLCGILLVVATGCGAIGDAILACDDRQKHAYLNDFITEGDFVYYLDKTTDTYGIVGTTEQGLKDVMYMPTHFRGKEVWRTEYTKILSMIAWESHSMDVGTCDKLYFNYMHHECTDVGDREYFSGEVNYLYFINGDYPIIINDLLGLNSCKTHTGYVSSVAYNSIKYFLQDQKGTIEIGNYIFQNGNRFKVIKCNTSYMFNYEDSPNQGYFFANDFERGGLIENTPYEPVREGYTFEGWYKEPECVTEWSFVTDKLPEPEFDDAGNLIFVETQLFAKWMAA